MKKTAHSKRLQQKFSLQKSSVAPMSKTEPKLQPQAALKTVEQVWHGWTLLVPLFDASDILVLSDDAAFVDLLRERYGSRVRTTGVSGPETRLIVAVSTLQQHHFLNRFSTIMQLHSKKSNDSASFHTAYVLCKNSYSPSFFTFLLRRAFRMLGFRFSSLSSLPALSFWGFSQRLFQKYYFFPDRSVCSHIINSRDVAGVSVFFDELSRFRILRFLRLLPLFVKRFVLFLSARECVVVLRG